MKMECKTCFYYRDSRIDNDGLEVKSFRCFLDPPIILRRGELNLTPRWSRPPVKMDDVCSHWNVNTSLSQQEKLAVKHR